MTVDTAEHCRRCVYLDIKPPGIALRCGWCRWCCRMGPEDDRLRGVKGMKTYYPTESPHD